MKYIKIIIIVISLLLFSAACDKNSAPDTTLGTEIPTEDSPETAAPQPEIEPEPETADIGAAAADLTDLSDLIVYEEGFSFVYNGYVIYMGDYIDGVVDKLGTALDYTESDSCTSEGMMKTYYYSGVEISAYAKTEADEYRIFSIILTDDSVTTAEGVYIGHTENDMIAAYGTDYESVPGVCKYTKNGTGLTFDLEGEDIICITYTLLEI